ncbi:GTA-gp10 family protein [Pseudomonas abietaniphila]|jgi:hypothetical protein|uniref:GTA-gp10 family protein n=1 Tax=Pseudomonas abietaniphila TaxID=89065 RepID=UPI000781C77A|nr:GTA-gp10 family protein [Pseudomonas abietaniphila]
MSKTDHGTVELNVGDDSYTLTFNLKAVKKIERMLGSVFIAMQEVQRFNLSAIIQVITAGAGLALKPSEQEALEEAVYQAGMISVTPTLIEYLSALLNPAAKTADQMAEAEAAAATGSAKK